MGQLLPVLVLVLSLCRGSLAALIPVKVGILLMTNNTNLPFGVPQMGPPIEVGVEVAKNTYGVDMTLVWHDYTGDCPLEKSLGHLAELKYIHKVDVVIGPACSQSMHACARLAEYLELPIFTGLGNLVVRDPNTDDMMETLTILSYSIGKLSGTCIIT